MKQAAIIAISLFFAAALAGIIIKVALAKPKTNTENTGDDPGTGTDGATTGLAMFDKLLELFQDKDEPVDGGGDGGETGVA